jgi:signal transduction histidine kinase
MGTANMPEHARANILIVDDKQDKVLALEALLEDLGENIVRAYSGREALRCLLQQEFAVILLDVNMPGMDGFETAALIRQRASSRHVPIIFVTALGDDAYSSRGYSLGAVDYIQTPVVPDVLRTKVAVFVELFRKSEQVRRQADALRRRAAQMQKLAAAAVAMSGAHSVERILQTVTDTARDVLGTHQAITLFIDPRSGNGKVQVASSFSEKYAEWRDRRLQLDALVQTAAFRSYTATRLSEAELPNHPDWEIVKNLTVPPVCGGMLAAPLTSRDRERLGIIYVCDRREGAFSADDEFVAVQLAQMSSIAIENTLFAHEREVNRIKDEFLSTLSHELRTPLNAVLGWTQLLAAEHHDSEFSHGLRVIERNAKAQAKLIEDLLDISRITSGKLELNLAPVHLGSVVDAAVDAIRPLAVDKGLSIEWNRPACDDQVSGDADRLQQVVWNLLSNAVKFTPKDGRIEVRLQSTLTHLELQVIDSGKGISAAFLPHVFDRFRQADSSSTRAHGGLGIGLTIVKHIIDLHGGTVSAHSPGAGQGATFTIALVKPVRGMQLAPDRPVRHSAAHPDLPDQSLSGAYALVVDDEPDARDFIAQVLQRAGAAVTTCSSVPQAIESIAQRLPDIIISDIAMPGEDGYDLARRIRRSVHAQDVPVIAVTAYARQEDRGKSMLAGFERHLSKPVDPRELVSVVESICRARRQGDAVNEATGERGRPSVSA